MSYEGMTNEELLRSLDECERDYRSKASYFESLLSRVKDVEKEVNDVAERYDSIADILESRGMVRKLGNG